MALPVVPAAVLAARGQDIELVDGTHKRIVYTFRAIMKVEAEFGHVNLALDTLARGGAHFFGNVASLIAAGLSHEVQDGGEPWTADDIGDLLDPVQLQAYAEAINEAMKAAFPTVPAAAPGDDAADPTRPSPGPNGSTTAPSPLAAVSPSSGP